MIDAMEPQGDAGVTHVAGLPPRFRPITLLGRGTEKRVYLARDAVLDRDVAIAAFDTTALGDLKGDLLREARIMARVSGTRHVVTIFEVIDGPVHLGLQLCEALAAAHRRHPGAPRRHRRRRAAQFRDVPPALAAAIHERTECRDIAISSATCTTRASPTCGASTSA